MSDAVELKKKRDKLKRIQSLKDGLPHLYSFPMYKWQEEFWNCNNTFQFIFKANQIGGSSVMIRRIIYYATEPKLWKRFIRAPKMVMYLYPDKKSLTREWQGKWAEFMPRNEYKDDHQYGWKENWDGNYVDSIEFNSGITLYFKTYGSGAENLQASTPAILACDEELPEDLWPELQMRIASPANKGAMYWLGCTPTRGQKYLAKIQSGETKIPDARVWTVSMYDCLSLANGDRSIWTKEKIQQIEQTLPSEREVQVRVHGLFKPVDSLAITQFDRKKHVKPWHPVKGWDIYAGIDYGVGGKTGHPSAISFVAVSPSYNAARVIKVWRGDNTQTTPDDVINKYLEMREEIGIDDVANVYYDHSCGSMGIISERAGLGFLKANKDRDHGFNLINSLFKNDMLHLYDQQNDHEMEKLIDEIEALTTSHDKKRAGDDVLDSLRYCLSSIPFNFENIKVTTHQPTQVPVNKGRHEVMEDDAFDSIEEEIDDWNELYG